MEVLSKDETEELSLVNYNTPNYIAKFLTKIESEQEERLLFISEFLDFNLNRSSKTLIKDAFELLTNPQILSKKVVLSQFFAGLTEVPFPVKSKEILSKILVKFLTKYSTTLDSDVVFSIIKIFCQSLKISSLDKKSQAKLSSAIAYYLKSKENEQEHFVSLVNENKRNVNFICLTGLLITEKIEM